MKRLVAAVAALIVLVAVAPPARAYTHFGASNNVGLSVQWSQARFPSTTEAIVVRSDGFADSLAAGALAGHINAPVLMNPPGGGLDPRISNELARLGVDDVRIIGGTAAVSEQTETDLETAGYTVTRIADENRLSTAAKVMQQPEFDGTGAVYVARAFGAGSSAFADSLGAGMLAGTQGFPLLLTATESLSPETLAAIGSAESLQAVFIVGGTAAVSQAVEDDLRSRGFQVARVAGQDRFETASLLAEQSFSGSEESIIALVEGLHDNSWASGYPASASSGGAVLLADGDTLPDATFDFLSSLSETEAATTDDLYCAPEVSHDACLSAEAALNG